VDIIPIQEGVQHYYKSGLASSTHRCYTTGQQCYLQFCTQFNITPLPTSEYTLMMFPAYLAKSGLAYTSIKVHFYAIGNWHSSCAQHDAYQAALTPRLEKVLWGIKKKQAITRQVRVWLPIATEIMHQIYGMLSTSPNEYQPIMLWAACCTAFFGFLRVGEMTVPNQESFDNSMHLSLRDISVDSRSNPTTIWLTIKQSKTDPFHAGVK